MPEYQYAIKVHLEENQTIENLVRFEVTKTTMSDFQKLIAKSETAEPKVVASGVLQVDSGEIYMETHKASMTTQQPGGVVSLQQLTREHFSKMMSFDIDQSATQSTQMASR